VKKIIVLLLLFLVFIIGFLPVRDPDFGWHYRCGEQFLTTGQLCLSNNFSYFLPDYKSFYTGHLYDILLALAYNQGGFQLISIIAAAILALSAYLFLKLVNENNIIGIFGFFITFFLSNNVFYLGLRPQILSYLLFLLVLLILKRQNKKEFFMIPALFIFCTNFHIGFFIGLVPLFFYVLHKRNLSSAVVFLLSLFSTLINPFGILVYKEIFNHALSPLNLMIAEWVRPVFWQMILIICLGLSALIKILVTKPLSLFGLLLVLFFSLLGLLAQRNFPYFYAVFFYIILRDVKFNLNHLHSLAAPLLAGIIIFVAIIGLPKTIESNTSWQTHCDYGAGVSSYPCQAIQKYPQLSGNVFANYEWGGFLIWKKPGIKVFVDGRMPAWKDENDNSPYQVYLEIMQAKNNWNEKLKIIKTDYLLIAGGTFLDLKLQKDPKKYGWVEKYRDNISVIYIKSH